MELLNFQSKPKKVVTIGGGTGTFVVLQGLKDKNVHLSSIVAMTDSGGSTGRLRDQLGVLPPGDLRQALVALSDMPEMWRKLFTYRFSGGDLEGHNFGNLFLTALEKITGSIEGAVDEASKLLDVKGQVIPITYSDCVLGAKYADGSIIEGEAIIDDAYTKRPRIKFMYLVPSAKISAKAETALSDADYIIFGPGDIFTSIVPNFLVEGFSEVLNKSKAKKIFVMNLMTKLGQTDDYKASDHIIEIERYSGCFLDYVFLNTRTPDEEIINWYKKTDNVDLVEDDLYDKRATEAKIIRTDLIEDLTHERVLVDKVKRSLIRHDPVKLGLALQKIIGC
jgi:uncharacterized cofD-like protein